MVTKQNLTGILARTSRINDSDKNAAYGLTELINGIANLLYTGPTALTDIKDDIIAGNITKDTYICLGLFLFVQVDTAENILTQNGITI
jgi:hypothetical protein